MSIRVILRENLDNLGQIGDIVQVSSGYARNYLLPRRLVLLADDAKVGELEHHKRVLEKKRQASKASAETIAQKIGEFSCTLNRKVGKNDKLFGSVTPNDIAEELKKAGFDVGKSQVLMKDPIKSLGVHTVTVQLQPDVETPLKVWVVKEE